MGGTPACRSTCSAENLQCCFGVGTGKATCELRLLAALWVRQNCLCRGCPAPTSCFAGMCGHPQHRELCNLRGHQRIA